MMFLLRKYRNCVLFLISLFWVAAASAGIADTIAISKLKGNIWLYTSYKWLEPDSMYFPANGMILVGKESVVIFDTPWDDAHTEKLLGLIEQRFQKPVSAAYITHFHSDRIGGIRTLQKHGIAAISSRQTQQLGIKGGYPATTAFDATDTTIRTPGQLAFELYYPGPGHTRDNIVIYLPGQKILYGGCFIKSADAKGLGNIADADTTAWPHSLRKLMAHFPYIKTVIPGHGEVGGKGLLVHTLELLGK